MFGGNIIITEVERPINKIFIYKFKNYKLVRSDEYIKYNSIIVREDHKVRVWNIGTEMQGNSPGTHRERICKMLMLGICNLGI